MFFLSCCAGYEDIAVDVFVSHRCGKETSINKESLSFFNIERVRGVVVTHIMERSPGARAGLKRGDVILSLENIEVNDKTDYSERVSTYPLGNTINMGILRGGKVESVSLKVSLLPASRVADYVKIWLGFTVNKIQQSLVRRYRLVTSQGVVVTSVTPNSVSDKIGVQSGAVRYTHLTLPTN